MKISKKELKKIIKEELEEITLGGGDDPSAFNALQTVSDRPSQFQGSETAFTRLMNAGISKEALQNAMDSLPDGWERDKSAAVRQIQDTIVSSEDLWQLLQDMSERDVDPEYFTKNVEAPDLSDALAKNRAAAAQRRANEAKAKK